MHGVANGARPRRRMDDMTTEYDYDAHAATYDARPRAVDDVEGGYVPGRVSDGYACSLDAATLRRVEQATGSLPRHSKQDR